MKDKDRDRKEIKKVLQYLKVARKSNSHIVYHALVDSHAFADLVIKPLENLCGWNEDDEKKIPEIAKNFEKETEGKTLKEKSKIFKNILKITGLFAAVGTAGLIGLSFVSKENHGKNKAEK